MRGSGKSLGNGLRLVVVEIVKGPQPWRATIPDAPTAATILGIVFLATGIHASVGFGTALVAMPLLAMLLGIPTATPLVALVMLTTVAAILWGTREHIDLRAAWQLVGASVFGLPVGLMLVRFAPEDTVTAVLGAILVLYGLYNLARPTLPKIEHPVWVIPFGFAAGLIGGAYNANGPPVVIYGALRRWSPDRFRATLQGFFLPADILICASHALGGFWSAHVFQLFALSLPAIALGLIVGGRLGRRIPPEQFGRILYVSVVLLGVLLFL